MRRLRLRRAAAAAVLAVGGTLAVASTAGAVVPEPGCEDDGDGYFGGGACQAVLEATPVCVGAVPYLDYAAVLEGSTATTLTVRWHDPAGNGQVLEDLPLSGRLLWPGTELDADGKAVDYPGWTQHADGSWTEGDAFDWAASSVDVTFAANPQATVTVAYPAEPDCAPVNPTDSGTTALPVSSGSSSTTVRAVLSDTGISAAPLLGTAGGLLLAGTTLLLVSRLRRPHGEDG